ncbi:hypothetical protein GCM10008174_13250 [Methylopila turkensis]|uniref:Uncharacterized protein n=1 Tax=Methylopila turkensis TaxID=1437816 RepID=A0A9W6N5W0_9HYPH|nr:hypothetical protein GCM10008174_13250 [Methylopila turkensis]
MTTRRAGAAFDAPEAAISAAAPTSMPKARREGAGRGSLDASGDRDDRGALAGTGFTCEANG